MGSSPAASSPIRVLADGKKTPASACAGRRDLRPESALMPRLALAAGLTLVRVADRLGGAERL